MTFDRAVTRGRILDSDVDLAQSAIADIRRRTDADSDLLPSRRRRPAKVIVRTPVHLTVLLQPCLMTAVTATEDAHFSGDRNVVLLRGFGCRPNVSLTRRTHCSRDPPYFDNLSGTGYRILGW